MIKFIIYRNVVFALALDMDLDEYWSQSGGIVYSGGSGIVPTPKQKTPPPKPSPSPKKPTKREKDDDDDGDDEHLRRVFVSGIPLGMEWQELKDLFREKVVHTHTHTHTRAHTHTHIIGSASWPKKETFNTILSGVVVELLGAHFLRTVHT